MNKTKEDSLEYQEAVADIRTARVRQSRACDLWMGPDEAPDLDDEAACIRFASRLTKFRAMEVAACAAAGVPNTRDAANQALAYAEARFRDIQQRHPEPTTMPPPRRDYPEDLVEAPLPAASRQQWEEYYTQIAEARRDAEREAGFPEA